ncbi:MAG TPA: FAD synthase [Thermoplasmatales archaeon]|nr:FAD synthase [Thermoplasmatales archaeon]
MVKVMATGVFDLLHMGHVHYLREAKAMGDELVVVVATDETVRRRKHVPITPQEMRRDLVEALKPVDRAVVGRTGDPLAIVEELKPDVIALGYDQRAEDLEKRLRERGITARVVRCSPYTEHDLHGTRRIIRKIEEKLQNNELYVGDE